MVPTSSNESPNTNSPELGSALQVSQRIDDVNSRSKYMIAVGKMLERSQNRASGNSITKSLFKCRKLWLCDWMSQAHNSLRSFWGALTDTRRGHQSTLGFLVRKPSFKECSSRVRGLLGRASDLSQVQDSDMRKKTSLLSVVCMSHRLSHTTNWTPVEVESVV